MSDEQAAEVYVRSLDTWPKVWAMLRTAYLAGLAAERERASRLCNLRSCSWSTEDDLRSQDYREGIEDAASQLRDAIRRDPQPEEAK